MLNFVFLNAVIHQSNTSYEKVRYLDPERDPGHDDNETGGQVSVKQVITKPPLKLENHLQTGEVAFKNFYYLVIQKDLDKWNL